VLKPWVHNSRNIPTHFFTIIIIIYEAMLSILNDLYNADIIGIILLTGTRFQRNQHNCSDPLAHA
jgi:hypothetical protein